MAGALAFASNAFADGGPRRGSIKDAPVAAPFSWTGLYFGASLGYAWSDVNWTHVPQTANSAFTDRGALGQDVSHNLDGLIGGGHIGYQQQFGQFVAGVEVSISGGDFKNSSISTFGAADDVFTSNANWITTANLRLGYSFNRWLAYVKGGWAGANISTSISDTVPGNVGAAGTQEFHSGWTAGAGLEYAVTNNWILGVDYTYIDLDSKVHSRISSATTNIVDNVTPDAIHALTARLTFKLGN